MVAVLLFLFVAAVPSRGWADGEDPPLAARRVLLGDFRTEFGTGDLAGLSLPVGGLGAELALAPTFRLRAEGLMLGSLGKGRDGRSACGGAGGELMFRLVPFPYWPVRPFLRNGAGFLLFLREPFLPGGGFYEFMLTWGAGLEITLTERWTLAIDAHYSHLSHGQGLGSFNPAFDGVGGSAALLWAPAPTRLPVSRQPDSDSTGQGRRSWVPGVLVDLSYGKADDAWMSSARLRLAQRLAPHLLALLDGEAGRLAGESYEELGLGLVGHSTWASLGLHAGYRKVCPEIRTTCPEIRTTCPEIRTSSGRPVPLCCVRWRNIRTKYYWPRACSFS